MKNLIYPLISFVLFGCATEEQLINNGTVTDVEGNEYQTVIINGQEWMAENLRTSTYADNVPIPNVTDIAEWENLTTGAWVHYGNNSQNEIPYGKLYNWYAVDSPRNVCPTGWHVPTISEWADLTDYLSGVAPVENTVPVAGGKMKSTGTQYWESPNVDATNESGFSGLPGGGRLRNNNFAFLSIGTRGHWWSSTDQGSSLANFYSLYNIDGAVHISTSYKRGGCSVRCVKD